MKFKTTLRLLLVVCILGVVIWFVERNVESTGQRRKRSKRVLAKPLRGVRNLTLEHAGLRAHCAKQHDVWMFERPLRARADEGAISRILTMLELLQREEVITAEQRRRRSLSLSDYGLEDPRAKFTIGDGVEEIVILVGNDVPVGSGVYVKLGSEKQVIATSKAVLTVLPKDMEELRDRAVLHGDPARTSRMEIQSPVAGFIQLAQIEGRWEIRQPLYARADNARIVNMLTALYALEVESFVWDPIVDWSVETAGIIDVKAGGAAARVETRGLAADEAAARIRVWVGGDEIGQELLIGKPVAGHDSQVYGKRRDTDSIYALGKEILDAFAVEVNALRDRALLAMKHQEIRRICIKHADRKLVLQWNPRSGWYVTQPSQWKADDHSVDGLIAGLLRINVLSFGDVANTNMVSLGLDMPSLSLEFSTEEGVTNRMFVGRQLSGSKSVHVRFDGKEQTYEVPSGIHALFGSDPSDALIYRDRTVLAIPPKDIVKISLYRAGLEESVVKDEYGKWQAVAETERAANTEAIENIIFRVSNLRASRAESHNPKDLSAYSLTRPQAVLTFGLGSGEGINKSIWIGSSVKDQGSYAMVQGQDIVFVLAPGMVDKLTGGVFLPIAEPETTSEK